MGEIPPDHLNYLHRIQKYLQEDVGQIQQADEDSFWETVNISNSIMV
jgi:hypothetical protein